MVLAPGSRHTLADRRQWWIGSGAAMVALFLIGTSAPVAARLGDYPMFGGQAVRYTLAVLVLAVALRLRGGARPVRLTGRDVMGLAVLGLIGIAGFNVFVVSAAQEADPALVGTVLAAAPVVLAVLGPVLRGLRPCRPVVRGSVLVTVGTATAAGLGDTSWLGLALCLGALVGEVAFALLAVPLIDRMGTLRTTTYAGAAAAVHLWVAGLVVDGPNGLLRVPDGDQLAALLYLAVAIAVAANLLWYAALPRVGADYAALFYAFTPVGAVTAGLVLHTGAPSIGELVGLVLVVGGLLVGTRRESQRISWATV